MAYTPIPFGTPLWHNPVNAAFTSQDARITTAEGQLAATPVIGETMPQDHNAIAWTSDPGDAIGATQPAVGVLTMTRLVVREESTLTDAAYLVSTVGSGLTAGQNFLGLYDVAGTLLRSTADQTANFGVQNLHTVPWSTPVVVPAGFYWAAFLVNGATPPFLARAAAWGAGAAGPLGMNVGLTATTARSAVFGAALTALPVSIDMSLRTLSTVNYWTVFS